MRGKEEEGDEGRGTPFSQLIFSEKCSEMLIFNLVPGACTEREESGC